MWLNHNIPFNMVVAFLACCSLFPLVPYACKAFILWHNSSAFTFSLYRVFSFVVSLSLHRNVTKMCLKFFRLYWHLSIVFIAFMKFSSVFLFVFFCIYVTTSLSSRDPRRIPLFIWCRFSISTYYRVIFFSLPFFSLDTEISL